MLWCSTVAFIIWLFLINSYYVGIFTRSLLTHPFRDFLNFLAHQQNVNGVFYTYQTFFAALVALIAGFLALLTPFLHHHLEKIKVIRDFEYELLEEVANLGANVTSLLESLPNYNVFLAEMIVHHQTFSNAKPVFWALNFSRASSFHGYRRWKEQGCRALSLVDLDAIDLVVNIGHVLHASHHFETALRSVESALPVKTQADKIARLREQYRASLETNGADKLLRLMHSF